MANTERKPLYLDFEKPLVELESQIEKIRQLATLNNLEISELIRSLQLRALQLRQKIFRNLSPAQKLQLARHPHRPTTLDYIQEISDEWIELCGDRCGLDNPALVGGIGRLAGQPVVMLGHQKGRNIKENISRNFGMAAPAGYRKASRLMEHANRFKMPLLTFIDTPGAWAGIEAEHQGQGEAIAYNLRQMFKLDVPIICTVIGEGGSGGALGIGVGDLLLMFEYAVYTVATPEACAAILWKDASQGNQAATALKLTAQDLKNLGIIDRVLPEPFAGNHSAPLAAAKILKQALLESLEKLTRLTAQQRRQLRYQKFRQIGVFTEIKKNATFK